MKAILTADLHFSAYNNDKIDANTGLPERLSGIYLTIINLIEYAKMYEIKNIIIAGDIFHNKSIIYSVAQSVLLDIVRNNKDIHWFIMSGNHDLSSMTGNGVSAIKFYEYCPPSSPVEEEASSLDLQKGLKLNIVENIDRFRERKYSRL